MTQRRDRLLVAAVVLCAASAIALAIAVNASTVDEEEEPEARTQDDMASEEIEDVDDVLFGAYDGPESPAFDLAPSQAAGEDGWRGRRRRDRPDASPAEREERRQRRIQRLAKRVKVLPLGRTQPTITAEAVVESFTEQLRPAMRQCIEEAGGFQAIRQAMASGERGGGRPRVSFDLGTDGRVVPSSIGIEPARTGPMQDCMRNAIAAMQMEPPGGEGARVEMPLGGRRRGGNDGGTQGGGGERGGERSREPRFQRGGEGATGDEARPRQPPPP